MVATRIIFLSVPDRRDLYLPFPVGGLQAGVGERVADDRIAANEFCPFTGNDIAPDCHTIAAKTGLGTGAGIRHASEKKRDETRET